jgi:1-acyl-sn-glycerol-3-phosphate acyltransferase
MASLSRAMARRHGRQYWLATSGTLRWSWRVVRTGLAFGAFGLGAIALAGLVLPLGLVTARTPAHRERRAQRLLHHAAALFIWFMTWLGLIRVRWIGLDKPADSAPRLIVANHPTLIDVVLLLAWLPQADCIVKSATRGNGFLRGLVSQAGYLSNDHGDAIVAACVARLREGRSVIVFPEGTRSPSTGLGAFQRGAAHIALMRGFPILPVLITCTPPTLGKGERWHEVPDHRVDFVVRAGSPIDPAPYLHGGTHAPAAARRLTADLRTYYETIVAHGDVDDGR